MATVIVWFRSDLRIADNPALHHALARGERVIPVYIHAPEELSPWQPGAASRWWLHHSLTALCVSLARLGCRLFVRHGPSGEVLGELVRESGASEVHLNRNYEPAAARRDEDVEQQLHADGMQTHAHHAALLFARGSACRPSVSRRSRIIRSGATFQTAPAPRGSRPNNTLARSARSKARGPCTIMRSAPIKPRTPKQPRRCIASSSGASSRTTCFTIIRLSTGHRSIGATPRFRGGATMRCCAHGSSGTPASRSSMRACASCGRRVGCTIACA